MWVPSPTLLAVVGPRSWPGRAVDGVDIVASSPRCTHCRITTLNKKKSGSFKACENQVDVEVGLGIFEYPINNKRCSKIGHKSAKSNVISFKVYRVMHWL